MIEFEFTAFDVPNEFVAETEKVYLTPFFKPLKMTGLSVALINSPV